MLNIASSSLRRSGLLSCSTPADWEKWDKLPAPQPWMRLDDPSDPINPNTPPPTGGGTGTGGGLEDPSDPINPSTPPPTGGGSGGGKG
jgi:hypothetical protein